MFFRTKYPANINLSSLNGKNGFVIAGAAADDYSGWVLSNAGDVNADGITDLVIGAPFALNSAGASYVVFGQIGVGGSGILNLQNLNGINGFAITGVTAGDESGYSVSNAGDVNGDGVSDLIIGAPYASGNAGVCYVVFGNSNVGGSGTLALSSLNGSNGFIVSGGSAGDETGYAVGGAADINHDGLFDFVIGAPNAGSGSGKIYIVFGKSGIGSTGSFSLSSLNGSNGFVIVGAVAGGHSGSAINFSGDINADGIADLVIGAPNAASTGVAYVVFGQSAIGGSGILNLSALNGNNGFSITGADANDYCGWSVGGVGDINGDGVSDLVIGAPYAANQAGSAYIIFGKSGIGNSGNIVLSSLNGLNGFAIVGVATSDHSSWSANYAGDINGDGITDLVIGAPTAFSAEGVSYIVFGETGIGGSGILRLTDLNGSNGFSISGVAVNDQSGTSVNSIGDINGDGIVDWGIGAPDASPEGVANAGASFIGFGERPALLTLLQNQLSIHEAQTVVIDSSCLNVTNAMNPAQDSMLQFTISNLQHGQFFSAMNTTAALRSFQQLQVRNQKILFTHDGSSWAPAYNVSLGYAHKFTVTASLAAKIFFQQSFVVVNNTLIINQGQTIILTNYLLSASDLYNSKNNPNLIFAVSNVKHGFFALTSNPTASVTRFLQAQVMNKNIQFAHDGSTIPPSYQVTAINGALSLAPQTSLVSFDTMPVLINNFMFINQGQTVYISLHNLNATNPYKPNTNLIYLISQTQHGYFSLLTNPSIPIATFSQAQIRAKNILFTADGSISSPGYAVSVSDGRLTTSSYAAIISFDAFPLFTSNSFIINQGQTITLTSSNLNAINPYNTAALLTFTMSDLQYCHFALLNNPTKVVTNFTQAQVQAGLIQFIDDYVSHAPSGNVTITDGRLTSTSQLLSITFNAAPVLINNFLSIDQGAVEILTSENLSATDPDDSADSLTFIISNVLYGHFELITQPGTATSSFSQMLVQNGAVKFITDGSAHPPSYNVTVSDGKMVITPSPANILFDAYPVLINNNLKINQGQTLILTSANLMATHLQNEQGLIFTASNVVHGAFALTDNPSNLLISFTQAQIKAGAIEFITDGGSDAPSYNVTVSDGQLTTMPSPAQIYFSTNPSGATERNIIIGTTVGGAVGALFAGIKIYLEIKTKKILQERMGEGESHIRREQAIYFKNVIVPIISKMFHSIKTTYLFGYRSEKSTKAFITHIENIIGKLVTLGVNIDFKDQHRERLLFEEEVVNQIKIATQKDYPCCSCSYLCSFFKPAITPQELEEKVNDIARSVKEAVAANKSPGLTRISVESPSAKSIELTPPLTP